MVEFDAVTVLVEVIRGSSGSPRLAEALRRRLHDKGLPFSVEHFLGYRLTVSASSHHEHDVNRELCDRVADHLTDELSQAACNGESDGVIVLFESASGVRVARGGELYGEQPYGEGHSDGEEWLGSFRFEPSWTGIGSAGGGATVACVVDEAKHAQHFLRKIRSKAEKRKNLPSKHVGTPFVVAVENHESELLPVTVLSALTGSRQHLGHGLTGDPCVPALIENASRGGWIELIRAWQYIDTPDIRLADYGAFGASEAGWASNLSAVLVAHNGGATMQWLPNPFAVEDLADARLLRVGLALDPLGAAPPDAYWLSPGPR
ncbi:MAG: hypothetical protein QM756_27890 [Polyangiaceae bacterium]